MAQSPVVYGDSVGYRVWPPTKVLHAKLVATNQDVSERPLAKKLVSTHSQAMCVSTHLRHVAVRIL